LVGVTRVAVGDGVTGEVAVPSGVLEKDGVRVFGMIFSVGLGVKRRIVPGRVPAGVEVGTNVAVNTGVINWLKTAVILMSMFCASGSISRNISLKIDISTGGISLA